MKLTSVENVDVPADLRDEHLRYRRTPFDPECEVDGLPMDDVELLKRYGTWMQALMVGRIKPYTSKQEHFLRVCKGELKPESHMETVWYRYRLEVLYWKAKSAAHRLGATSSISYSDVRNQFVHLARAGHGGACEWLAKQEKSLQRGESKSPRVDWPSGESGSYGGRSIFDWPYPLTHEVNGGVVQPY